MNTKKIITLIGVICLFICETNAQRGKKRGLSNSVSAISAEDLGEREFISVDELIQKQTIGLAVGAGFGQDFKESTLCFSLEYLRQINSSDKKGLYVGAEATYETTSFEEFSSNTLKFGPKIQYNTPITPSQETQLAVGLMGNFATGNNDNNGFEDDFTGLILCAYTGVNIRVSTQWSVGVQLPVFIYEDYTFEPEMGDEFSLDNTTLLVNKNNPAKIVVRHSF
ncbi:hypothetical protein [uncultured Psychroserpens sp.]|uniref:hypothetical protein n=1 Tax=uncultured Psychroserpens sp. TaxID=255436 RepID=UPI00261ED918|nr:hypothetical protein [uncultured Psychroserpens sp.]